MNALRSLIVLIGIATVASLPAAAPAPAKTHSLYMGADIAIERNKKFYQVEDVSGSAFKIRVGEREVLVPTRGSANNLRIDHQLKIGGSTATMDKLVAERVYTSARDPRRQFERDAGAAGGAAASADLANIQVQQAEAAFIYMGTQDPRAPPEYIQQLKELVEVSKQGQANAMAQLEAQQNSTSVHADRMQVKEAEGNFDAIEVAFEVSSPVPLEDPYLVIIARIREPGARAGMSRNWIYADALDPVGAKPRFVRVREGGFPPGFQLDDCQVRIYNRGREVPTNISPKRIELSREEALQYIVMEYQSAHKGETVEAAPAFAELPEEVQSRVAAGELAKAYFVKVDAGGNARGAFLDRECRRPVGDPALEGLFAEMLFKPALEKGRPVDGVAQVRLGELKL